MHFPTALPRCVALRNQSSARLTDRVHHAVVQLGKSLDTANPLAWQIVAHKHRQGADGRAFRGEGWRPKLISAVITPSNQLSSWAFLPPSTSSPRRLISVQPP